MRNRLLSPARVRAGMKVACRQLGSRTTVPLGMVNARSSAPLPVTPMIDHMELHEIIRQRRSELDMSQTDLAAKVGVDKRQIRRYESGHTQPTLPIAKAIAQALGISIDELAGEQTHRVNLTGRWWASWQTSRSGVEKVATQEV